MICFLRAEIPSLRVLQVERRSDSASFRKPRILISHDDCSPAWCRV